MKTIILLSKSKMEYIVISPAQIHSHCFECHLLIDQVASYLDSTLKKIMSINFVFTFQLCDHFIDFTNDAMVSGTLTS